MRSAPKLVNKHDDKLSVSLLYHHEHNSVWLVEEDEDRDDVYVDGDAVAFATGDTLATFIADDSCCGRTKVGLVERGELERVKKTRRRNCIIQEDIQSS